MFMKLDVLTEGLAFLVVLCLVVFCPYTLFSITLTLGRCDDG